MSTTNETGNIRTQHSGMKVAEYEAHLMRVREALVGRGVETLDLCYPPQVESSTGFTPESTNRQTAVVVPA